MKALLRLACGVDEAWYGVASLLRELYHCLESAAESQDSKDVVDGSTKALLTLD